MSHQHSADFGPPLTHDHTGGDEQQHDHADAGLGLSRTPRPWPEETYPDAEQLAAWITTCTPQERLSWADRAITGAMIADTCRVHRHEERLAVEIHPTTVIAAYVLGYCHADNGDSNLLDKLEPRGVGFDLTDEEADAIEAFLTAATTGGSQ
jgi:hypothetical protein